jgi:hypothetical protein
LTLGDALSISQRTADQCRCVLGGELFPALRGSESVAATTRRETDHDHRCKCENSMTQAWFTAVPVESGATNGTVMSRWFQALNLAGRVNFQRTAALLALTTSPLCPRSSSSSHAQHSTSDYLSLSLNTAPTAFGRNQRRCLKTARGRLFLINLQVVSARPAPHVFNNIPPPPATHP